MTHEVVVPKWGLTIEQVTLLEWYKQAGDSVAAGEAIAEVETDKATQEIVSDVAGVIVELLVEEGVDLDVGEPIARIDL